MCRNCDEPSFDKDEGNSLDRALELNAVKGKVDQSHGTCSTAMQNLEKEIMALDEVTSVLGNKLESVLTGDDVAETKVAAGIVGANPVREPQSPLARSISEKASRIKIIRRRIEDFNASVDL